MQTTVYFVRHGEVDNPQQLYYGRLPGYPLSETGQAQASAAAAYLNTVVLDAAYTSPQLRARQTAEVICAKHQRLIPQTLELLNEVYTPYDGAPYAELVPRDFDLYTDSVAPFEQPEDILQRALDFFTMTLEKHAGQHVAAVTHGDVIAFAILWAMHKRPDLSYRHTLSALGLDDDYPAPASITLFNFEKPLVKGRPTCRYARPY